MLQRQIGAGRQFPDEGMAKIPFGKEQVRGLPCRNLFVRLAHKLSKLLVASERKSRQVFAMELPPQAAGYLLPRSGTEFTTGFARKAMPEAAAPTKKPAPRKGSREPYAGARQLWSA
jgi:hypothetical protein